MSGILRVNSMTGRSYIISLDKVIFLEESTDGESTYIHLIENRTIQCTERIHDIEETIKRILK